MDGFMFVSLGLWIILLPFRLVLAATTTLYFVLFLPKNLGSSINFRDARLSRPRRGGPGPTPWQALPDFFPAFLRGRVTRTYPAFSLRLLIDQSPFSSKRLRRLRPSTLRRVQRVLDSDWCPLRDLPEPALADSPSPKSLRSSILEKRAFKKAQKARPRKRGHHPHPPHSSVALATDAGALSNLSKTLLRIERLLESSLCKTKNTMSGKSDESRPATPSETSDYLVISVMPRPGQPGALDVFTGQNATEYLDEFNDECEIHRVKPDRRVLLFPHFCTPSIKELVKILPGYDVKDWDALQSDVKKLYWANDHPKNTTTALNALIRNAANLPLNVFIIKFSSITDVLVSKGTLSEVDRFAKLLEGLEERMRNKIIKLCTQKGWKISDQDGGTDPLFPEIKAFLENEAKTTERVMVYEKDHSIRGGPSDEKVSSPPAIVSPTTTAVASPVLDPMQALTEQFAALALMIKQALPTVPVPTMVPSVSVPVLPAMSPTDMSVPRPSRLSRCVWCDGTDHMRRTCLSFIEAVNAGVVRLNDEGRIILVRTGVQLPTAFGRGGIKSLCEAFNPPPVARQSSVNTISYDDGESSSVSWKARAIEIVDLDECADVNVEEKRKRGDGPPWQKQARPKTGKGSTPAAQPSSQEPSQPSATASSPPPPSDTMNIDEDHPKPKFKLQSELGKTISPAVVGEKIMNAPLTLTIKEFLAVSPDMSNYIHEQTRRKRAPIEPGSAALAVVDARSASVSHSIEKPFYALPSPRTKVVINGEVSVRALLDTGSELNIMSAECFRTMDYPIDENINWRINGYNSGIENELEERYGWSDGQVVGVLHNLPIEIGGIEVKQHVFVVEHLPAKLILGRPWERTTRMTYSNEDDGCLWVTFRSPDNMKEVRTLAVPADHERNRDTVRPKE